MSGLADANTRPAFSRLLKVEDVPPEGLDPTISATESERQAVAAQNGLEGLAKLEGTLHVAPWRKGGIAATGEMRARVTQICVVSLDPFDSEIVEPIDVKFAPMTAPLVEDERRAAKAAPRRRSPPPVMPTPSSELGGEDAPDPIIDGRVDLGALVAEFLVLALEPYPRKPGVEFAAPAVAADEKIEESPFAKLAALKDAPGHS
jgi:hypothetical protein